MPGTEATPTCCAAIRQGIILWGAAADRQSDYLWEMGVRSRQPPGARVAFVAAMQLD